MFLFLVLTILTFINAFASRIISFILQRMIYDKSIEIICSQITDLKKEQSEISMIDEFAKYAKMQRKINRLHHEKKSLVAGYSMKVSSIKYISLFITYGVISLTFLILVWIYRGETIAQLPGEWLWPFPNMFSWFSSIPGCVSISSWIIISSSASKVIAKCF